MGEGGSGPGQMSPGSDCSAAVGVSSPMTRRMLSLSPTGVFGLKPPLNGGFHHVSPQPPRASARGNNNAGVRPGSAIGRMK